MSPSYTDLKGAFLILIFSGCLQLLQAQEKSFLFSHYSFNDGLYEESVNRLNKDQKGYIWICTENALQRFDGKRFLSFLPGSALPPGVLRDAKMDNNNRLWLLSDDATVGYFDPVSLKYTRINIEMPPASSKIIHQLYTDAQNRVYLVWYKQGFITYTDASRKASAANNPFTLPADWKPMNFQQDKDQQLWIGTTMGLVKFNPTAKTLSYRDHNTDNDPVITAFAPVRETGLFYRDLHDHAWLVSWKDQFILRSVNIKTGEQQDWDKKISQLQQGAYFVPLKFLEYSDGSVWLTGSNLMARIDPEQNTIQLIPPEAPGEYSIRFNHVLDLMEDREKSLWVATNKGLYRFNPASNRFFVVRNRRYTDEKNTVTETTGFLETQNGTLLVSSWGNGLFSYDQQFRPVPFPGISINNLRNTGMVWDILQRKNGDIWLAMQSFSSMLDGTWGYDRSGTTTTKISSKREAFTEDFAIRLQNVQLECADALYIIQSRDCPEAFFYCDPPYYNSNCGHYDGYTEADFEALLKALASIKGRFLLSSYPSDLLSKYGAKNGWKTRSVEQRVSVNKGYGKKKVEVLTANFQI